MQEKEEEEEEEEEGWLVSHIHTTEALSAQNASCTLR